jgi:hypothetical protein
VVDPHGRTKSFWVVSNLQMLAMHPGHIVELGLEERRQASLATAFENFVAINTLANKFNPGSYWPKLLEEE